MQNNPRTVIDKGLDTSSEASPHDPLERLWPSRYDRDLRFPFPYHLTSEEGWAGDVGFFRIRPGLPPLFVTLGHIRDVYPGALTLRPAHGYTECASRVFR